MYFIIIMAFALILSDNLPPDQCNLFRDRPVTAGLSLYGTLAIALGQLVIVWIYAVVIRGKARSKLDGSAEGHDAAADSLASFQFAFLFILSAMLILTMVFTPWAVLIRSGWGLDRIPLIGDLILLVPFFMSLMIFWSVLYPVEVRLREDACIGAPASPVQPEKSTIAALRASKYGSSQPLYTLKNHLIDKFRHQIFILAVPMSLIVFAKHIIYHYADWLVPMPKSELLKGLILNTALGTTSVCVLAMAPVMLRFIWVTEPLPDGPLRDRFVATCQRIGLRYREILLWHTHGMTINAAVMGFIAPLRYILVSDALLETLDEDEIEAVFGHEAGHVRHWHLPFFGLFAIVSMYIAGGVMYLFVLMNPHFDPALLQLVALIILLLMWLFGFSWLSRKFERQADLFGVRCITPDIHACSDRCPVHGSQTRDGLCFSAANIFGRTLAKIADLNGIPREAPSWRHGSIESRCKLIENFVSDTPALKQFDRRVYQIKMTLAAIAVISSLIAVWVYYQPVASAMGWH